MAGFRSAAPPVVLGATAILPWVAVDGDDVPQSASSATFVVRTAAGLGDGTNLVASTAATAVSGVTGAYYISQVMSAGLGFAAGTTYHFIVTWVISGTTRRQFIDVPVI